MFSAILPATPRRGMSSSFAADWNWRSATFAAGAGPAASVLWNPLVGAGRGVAVALEDVFPAFINVLPVMKICLVQLFFEPTVDPELGVALFRHAGR